MREHRQNATISNEMPTPSSLTVKTKRKSKENPYKPVLTVVRNLLRKKLRNLIFNNNF